MRIRPVVAAACLLLFASCVLPARSFGAYEEKAATTADAVLSAVENARLAIKAAREDRAFAPYVTTLLDEAEQDASGAQGTFGSIQPPDDMSAALSDRLGPLLEHAVKAIGDLREAARGGRMADLARGETPLARASKDLGAFLEAHG
jgi:hypothetical protein